MRVAREALGPLITLALWIGVMLWVAQHRRGNLAFVEWLAVLGGLITLQLLLDLHTPHLGDVVIGALHLTGAVVLVVRRHRAMKPPRA